MRTNDKFYTVVDGKIYRLNVLGIKETTYQDNTKSTEYEFYNPNGIGNNIHRKEDEIFKTKKEVFDYLKKNVIEYEINVKVKKTPKPNTKYNILDNVIYYNEGNKKCVGTIVGIEMEINAFSDARGWEIVYVVQNGGIIRMNPSNIEKKIK